MSAIVVIGAAAVVASEVGLSPWAVVAVVASVAAVGAIVARRCLVNVVSGLILFLLRPYGPGERLEVYAPERGGYIEAEIAHLGLVNTRLVADSGELVVPNSRLLLRSPLAAPTVHRDVSRKTSKQA
jgi:small-conductance mechanosensitive channel